MKWWTFFLLGLCAALVFSVGSPAQADCGLVGTYWRAVAIDGNPVTVESSKREPHLVFSAENQVSGSSGCNRLTGSFQQEGGSLKFGPMAMTKMACPPPLNTLEMSFVGALNATTAMQISGKTLELKDAAGKVRMRLEAR